MKKLLLTSLSLSLCLCCAVNVSAFDISSIAPDNSFVFSLGRNVEADKEYLRNIANSYSDKFIVTEEQTVDISNIDSFYTVLSKPLTVEELDLGKTQIELDKVCDDEYKKHLNSFKVLGGLAGYSAEFEPISYFKIYRNITLVGGYVEYHKIHTDAYEAYWQYICNLEAMTKEVVPYEMRMKLVEKFKVLSDFIDSDKTFKIFILEDGQIDSMWEAEVIKFEEIIKNNCDSFDLLYTVWIYCYGRRNGTCTGH